MLARNYDPTLGRMNQIDPMAHVYSGISPYAYALNTPMNAIDPDGRLVIFINGQHGGDFGYTYWGYDLVTGVLAASNETRSPIFKDGSSGGWARTFIPFYSNFNPINRFNAGLREGRKEAKKIFDSLAPEETIKIITHSMGGIYGRGYLKALLEYAAKNNIDANRIQFIIDLDMFQAGSYFGRIGIENTTHLIRGGGFSNLGWLANQDAEGANNIFLEGDNSHSASSFENDLINLIEELISGGQLVYDEENDVWVFTPSDSKNNLNSDN